MEWIFYTIFGLMLIGFAIYGRRIHKQEKKLRKEYEELTKEKSEEKAEQKEVDFKSYDFAESPFFDCYKYYS